MTSVRPADPINALAYDQRGHGDSRAGNADTLPAFAGDVATMIGAAGGATIAVGASLGGFAALLTLADPDVEQRVARLVLVDVMPVPPPARTRDVLRVALGDRVNEPIVSDILAGGPELTGIAVRLTVPVLLVRGTRSPTTRSRPSGRGTSGRARCPPRRSRST